ncbi:sulfatase-like hydrolase/transferase [Streptomyces sp. NPDC057889]|uniref:sulfatase-like hydrolase/transferase n=1 Tax=unclassified Streptomyces TaxID=2593676 RepID=UPI003681EF85
MTDKTTETMAEKPNILFLMTDQHRIDTLGCYGNDVVRTPNLDRIAGDGARLDRCYTPTAICTPARASLLTGLHPFRHQLLANYEWNSGGREELPDGLPILSRELREAGYNVGHVGKWHVGRDRGPEYYGHDAEHLPGAVNGTNLPSYLTWLDRTGQVKPKVQDASHGLLPDGSPGHLIAGRLDQPTEASFEQFLTDRALKTLRGYVSDHQDSAKPFYLACQYFGPHLPYLVPDKYYDMYDPADVILPASMAETFAGKPQVQQRYNEYWSADRFSADEWRKLIAVYWGYVTMIDDQIGRLLDVLDEAGLYANTAIMFTADHGEFTGAHRLNDKGPAMYEDIYRIPGLMRVPGAEPTAVRQFTSLIDFTATIRDLAGITPDIPGDGQSLLPLVRGEEPADWRQHILAEFHGHHFPYPQRMIRTDRYKLVWNPESVNELYDLDQDPHELLNVYTSPAHRSVRQELSEKLYTELRERGDMFYRWMHFMADLDRTNREPADTGAQPERRPTVSSTDWVRGAQPSAPVTG